MSGEAPKKRCPNIAWAFWHAHSLQLNPDQTLVFLAIAERVGIDLTYRATLEQLVADTRIKRRTLQPTVKALLERNDCIAGERTREGYIYTLKRPPEAVIKPALHTPLVWEDEAPEAENVSNPEVQNLHDTPPVVLTPEVQDLHDPTPKSAKFARPEVQNLHLPLMMYPQESLKNKEESPRLSRTPKPARGGERMSMASFAAWWAEYPVQDGEVPARIAYARALRKASPEELLDGLRRYQFRDDPRYQPFAARWLTEERWRTKVTAMIDPALRAAGLTPEMLAGEFAEDPTTTQLLAVGGWR